MGSGQNIGYNKADSIPSDTKQTPMQKFKGFQGVFLVYSSFVALGSILVLSGILLSPSEPGNALLIGLSLPRLVFALGLFIAFIFFISLTIKASRDREWTERLLEQWFGGGPFSKGTIWLAGISLGLGWIGFFTPPYRFGARADYWSRIQPALAFILFVSAATLTLIVIRRSKSALHDRGIWRTLGSSLVLFLICLIVLGFVFLSGFGIRTLDNYWYGAGVPLLASQLIIAIIGGVLFLRFENQTRGWKSSRSDLIIFFLIYGFTAILWMREPLQKSFFFTGPYPPNQAFYPFSDSAVFDTASQFALIGQGIFNGLFFERPFYLGFLVYLHSLFGENYETLMAVQAGIFAILPALIYLIGRSLNTRAVGFACAIIAAFRGINSISASNMIDLASPKMMLTDFPTAIGIALVILLTCEWLKKPMQKWHYALWVGGTIGFTLMLRTNALLLLLLIPLYVLFKFSHERRKWLASSFFLVLAIVAITLPWELRNQSLGWTMYSSIVTKFQNVIRERYPSSSGPGSSLPQEQRLALISFKQAQAIFALYHHNGIAEANKPCDQVTCFAPNHFLHNIVTSVLFLPTSPTLDDLRHTAKENFPYWQPKWDGSFTAASMFFFVINIFFITLGIRLAWKEGRLHGMAPLAVFGFYNLSNAFARTSGGRYVVPMDWIISIYFMIGVLQMIQWSAEIAAVKSGPVFGIQNPAESGLTRHKYSLLKVVFILAILFGVGALVPYSEKLHPPRYTDFNYTKALEEREQIIASAGLTIKEIDDFLKSPTAEMSVGRMLYPRYYNINRGEIYYYPYVEMGFPRMAFALIGPKGEQGVVLPGDAPKYFPHGAEVIVVGCREEKYLDALAVILLDENGAVYARAPKSELECPLRQPVCDDNRVCR